MRNLGPLGTRAKSKLGQTMLLQTVQSASSQQQICCSWQRKKQSVEGVYLPVVKFTSHTSAGSGGRAHALVRSRHCAAMARHICRGKIAQSHIQMVPGESHTNWEPATQQDPDGVQQMGARSHRYRSTSLCFLRQEGCLSSGAGASGLRCSSGLLASPFRQSSSRVARQHLR